MDHGFFRPRRSERSFVSRRVEETIDEVSEAIRDDELRLLFSTCLPNTLDTTIRFTEPPTGEPETFVITGDIPAMWHRDSTCQVWPYVRFVADDPDADRLVRGLIRRHVRNVLADPYANSFIEDLNALNPRKIEERVDKRPGVWCRRYQLDSFGMVMRVSHEYWRLTGNATPFDDDWLQAVRSHVEILQLFQQGTDTLPRPEYHFQRRAFEPFDTLPLHGYGQPCRTCGLTRSFFRPSDDFCLLPYHIPDNALAVWGLERLAEMLDALRPDEELAATARTLASEVRAALLEHGTVDHPEFGTIFAYEVDGYGCAYRMDDANIPNLLGLPYLDPSWRDSPIWQSTRRFVLSEWNPYFVSGTALTGLGGPHYGRAAGRSAPDEQGLGFVFPLGLAMQAMTSDDESEIVSCLGYLRRARTSRFLLPEAAWKDDPSAYQRDWFCWANSFFGELILHLYVSNPDVLQAQF